MTGLLGVEWNVEPLLTHSFARGAYAALRRKRNYCGFASEEFHFALVSEMRLSTLRLVATAAGGRCHP